MLLVLPIAVLLLVAGWLTLSIIGGPDTLGLAALMPLGVPAGDAVSSAVAALTAVVLAIGLARHKTWLALAAVAAFSAGALVHAELLGETVPAAVDVVALLALLAALPRLVAGTGRRGLTTARAAHRAGCGAAAGGCARPEGR